MAGAPTGPLKPSPALPPPAAGRRLRRVYDLLFERFGPQNWWPARTPFEVCVGAILTQSVAWTNVEKAIANLDAVGLLDPARLLEALRSDWRGVAERIRPAGYYNAKARKLQAFVEHLHARHGGSLDRLFALPLPAARAELLGVHGIGPETADSMLLYAGNLPAFVVDAYTRRIFARLGHCPADISYEDLRRHFMDNLPADVPLFNEYHALIVALGKGFCLKNRPRCHACPLAGLCPAAGRAAPPDRAADAAADRAAGSRVNSNK